MKKDGRRETFDRGKLVTNILKACEKRPIPRARVEEMVSEIEAELRGSGEPEIPVHLIGEVVMKKLKTLDKVAYIRFASVYREFEDIESFERELESLK
jgi:transcriptional repressor NrdR